MHEICLKSIKSDKSNSFFIVIWNSFILSKTIGVEGCGEHMTHHYNCENGRFLGVLLVAFFSACKTSTLFCKSAIV